MYNKVTQEEKDAYKESGSVKRGYINIIPLLSSEKEIKLDEYDLKSFTILDDIYTPEEGIIGSVIAKQLTLNLFKPSNIDLENRECSAFVGVDMIENGVQVTKYTPYGNFIIQKPENETLTENTTFEAFDYMVKFNEIYKDELEYPCTLKDVLKSICEQSKVELGTTDFPNMNFVVEDNQFVSGETCRDVLKAIAQMACSYAHIGRDNKLYLYFPTTYNATKEVEKIDKKVYYPDIKINNKYGPVNRVVLRMSQIEGENVVQEDKDSIQKDGLHELVIKDNPFTYTQEKREEAIKEIWNVAKGFNYVDYETTYIGLPYHDVGDAINIEYETKDSQTEDIITQEINTYIFTNEITYSGSLKGSISAIADTEAETKYAFIPQLSNRLTHTEILVNKATSEITLIAEEQQQQSEKLSGVEKQSNETANKFSEFLSTTYEQDISNLQDQIDGAIQFWNGPDIPTLNNYPANEWKTEQDNINHQADIYTVIQDVEGEMKQGKSYRFDKVNGVWQWIELTDNELSAVQALANSKAKVFVTTPIPPYNVGDLWLKDKELYECIKSKDANGKFEESDWQKATKYTDDTKANEVDGKLTKTNERVSKVEIDLNSITTRVESTETKLTETEKNIGNIESELDAEGRFEKQKQVTIDSAEGVLYNQTIYGESSQETREGYNLFNKYGDFSYSYGSATDSTSLQEDGTIISTSRISQLRSKGQLIKNLKSNTDYTVSGIILSKKERGKDNNFCLIDILPYENTTTIKRTYISNSENLPYKFKFTFNTGENTSIWISLNGMDTSNSESTIPVFDEIMIYEGTIDKEYQEYGTMPSIDFPSKVVSVSGGIDYKTTGKNLYNVKDTSSISHSTVDNEGWITTTLDNASGSSTMFGNFPTNPSKALKPNTQYYIITEIKDIQGTLSDINITNNGNVSQFLDLINYKSKDVKANKIFINKATTKEDINTTTFLRTFVSCSAGQSGSITFRISVIEDVGQEITEDNFKYDPYKEFNTTIELPEGVELCSLPEGTRDYIDSDGVIHKKINKIEVDSFSSVYNLDKRAVFNISPKDCALMLYPHLQDLICTHAIADNTNELQEEYKYKVSCRYANGAKHFYIFMPLTYFSSTTDKTIILQEMNEILKAEKEKGTPLTFYYLKNEEDTSQKLAESEIEKLQNLKTFLGVTNITITAPLSASYSKNTKLNEVYAKQKYVDNKFAQQEITNDSIKSTVSETQTVIQSNSNSIDEINDTLAELNGTTEDLKEDLNITKQQFNTQYEQTSKSFELSINEINEKIENGVLATSVKTTSGTFDKDGLRIKKTDSEMESLLNNEGLYVNKGTTNLLTCDKDGVITENLYVRTYLTAGYHRTEGFIEDGKKRTGVFYQGGANE